MQISFTSIALSAMIAGGALVAIKQPVLQSKKIAVKANLIVCPPPQKADKDINGQWYLQPVLASDTAAGKYPTITFNTAKKSFTGNTGCNRMSGNFQMTDTSLTISERIMLTKMACPGYNEGAFIKTLLNTNRYKKEDSVLVLMFDQTELSRWTRKPYRAPVGKRT